ncbi:MAG: hypothetical protein M3N39_05725 [Pseudomonadota bacterium]|nr:hypothetical protein [Pseudomonadota bacterium]
MPAALALKRLIVSDLEELRNRYGGMGAAEEARLITKFCLWVGFALVFLVLARGKTFSMAYAADLMVFYDGGERVLSGQLPNRDFHTPLGLLAYLLPALGLWVGESLGRMMPIATAAFAAIFLPLLIHICVSRLPLKQGLFFAFWALALVVTPASIGELEPSFAMFYNRWGYGLLSLLFLLFLPRLRGGNSDWKDALTLALVLLLTFYLKISYFAVAAVITLPLLYFVETRRIALIGGLLAIGCINLIHLAWGGTFGYLQDISVAAQSSGAIRGSIGVLVQLALNDAATLFPFLLILGLCAAGGISFRILLLCLAIAGAGLLLSNQNYQGLGIPTLVPAAILAVTSLEAKLKRSDGGSLRLAATLLLATLVVPPAFSATRSALVHMAQPDGSSSKAARVAEINGLQAKDVLSDGVDAEGIDKARQFYRVGTGDLNVVQILRKRLWQTEYLSTLKDAEALLQSDPALSGKIFVLDFANPLNALLGRRAPQGVDSWYHRGRTFEEGIFRSPEQTFADVDVIMVPKAPVDPTAYFLLKQIYGDYIAQHYRVAAASDYWLAYAPRTEAEAAPSSR